MICPYWIGLHYYYGDVDELCDHFSPHRLLGTLKCTRVHTSSRPKPLYLSKFLDKQIGNIRNISPSLHATREQVLGTEISGCLGMPADGRCLGMPADSRCLGMTADSMCLGMERRQKFQPSISEDVIEHVSYDHSPFNCKQPLLQTPAIFSSYKLY